MTDYYEGQTVILQGFFTDQNDAPIDPSTVTLSVRAPDGTVTTPAFTNPAVGTYESELLLADDGDWWWQWFGSTTYGSAIDEGMVCAKKSVVVPV